MGPFFNPTSSHFFAASRSNLVFGSYSDSSALGRWKVNGAAVCDGLIGKCSCNCFWQLYTRLTFLVSLKSKALEKTPTSQNRAAAPAPQFILKSKLLCCQNRNWSNKCRPKAIPLLLPPLQNSQKSPQSILWTEDTFDLQALFFPKESVFLAAYSEPPLSIHFF